jgi:hypothetical protein
MKKIYLSMAALPFLMTSIQADVTYKMLSVPTKGKIYNGATQLVVNSTFTQSNIDANLIKYTPNPNINGADAFNFNYTDGLITSGTQVFNITINPINDAPVLTVADITVQDKGTVSLAGKITATDPEGTAVIFTISSLPTKGTIKKSGVDVTTGTTFILSDITTGKITYVSNTVGAIATDSFTVNASDGLLSDSKTISVAITTALGVACNDGDANTFNDVYIVSAGSLVCVGTVKTCANTPTLAGCSCNDNNANTFNDIYNGSGICVGTVMTCANTPTMNGCACNDNNALTINDKYNTSGICVGTSIVGTTCNDNNAQTINDVYNSSGVCIGTNVQGKPCNDNNINTINDVYINGVCVGTVPADGTACNDNNALTINDRVWGGICQGYQSYMTGKCSLSDQIECKYETVVNHNNQVAYLEENVNGVTTCTKVWLKTALSKPKYGNYTFSYYLNTGCVSISDYKYWH